MAVVCPLRQKPLHRFPPLHLRIDYSQWGCGREGKTFDTGRRHHCGSSRDPFPYNPCEGAWLPSWSLDGGTIPVRSGERPSVRLRTRDTMETVTHGRLTRTCTAPRESHWRPIIATPCHSANRSHKATIRRIATCTLSRTTAFDRVLRSSFARPAQRVRLTQHPPTHLRVLAEPTR